MNENSHGQFEEANREIRELIILLMFQKHTEVVEDEAEKFLNDETQREIDWVEKSFAKMFLWFFKKLFWFFIV